MSRTKIHVMEDWPKVKDKVINKKFPLSESNDLSKSSEFISPGSFRSLANSLILSVDLTESNSKIMLPFLLAY